MRQNKTMVREINVLNLARCLCLVVAALCAGACCLAESRTELSDAMFATDGKGGLYFEDVLREQTVYLDVTDYVVQGGSEPDSFFIMHYPQGFGDEVDARIKAFVKRLGGQYLVGDGRKRLPSMRLNKENGWPPMGCLRDITAVFCTNACTQNL